MKSLSAGDKACEMSLALDLHFPGAGRLRIKVQAMKSPYPRILEGTGRWNLA